MRPAQRPSDPDGSGGRRSWAAAGDRLVRRLLVVQLQQRRAEQTDHPDEMAKRRLRLPALPLAHRTLNDSQQLRQLVLRQPSRLARLPDPDAQPGSWLLRHYRTFSRWGHAASSPASGSRASTSNSRPPSGSATPESPCNQPTSWRSVSRLGGSATSSPCPSHRTPVPWPIGAYRGARSPTLVRNCTSPKPASSTGPGSASNAASHARTCAGRALWRSSTTPNAAHATVATFASHSPPVHHCATVTTSVVASAISMPSSRCRAGLGQSSWPQEQPSRVHPSASGRSGTGQWHGSIGTPMLASAIPASSSPAVRSPSPAGSRPPTMNAISGPPTSWIAPAPRPQARPAAATPSARRTTAPRPAARPPAPAPATTPARARPAGRSEAATPARHAQAAPPGPRRATRSRPAPCGRPSPQAEAGPHLPGLPGCHRARGHEATPTPPPSPPDRPARRRPPMPPPSWPRSPDTTTPAQSTPTSSPASQHRRSRQPRPARPSDGAPPLDTTAAHTSSPSALRRSPPPDGALAPPRSRTPPSGAQPPTAQIPPSTSTPLLTRSRRPPLCRRLPSSATFRRTLSTLDEQKTLPGLMLSRQQQMFARHRVAEMTEWRVILGQAVRTRRRELGLTLTEASRAIGISRSHLNLIELGRATGISRESAGKIDASLDFKRELLALLPTDDKAPRVVSSEQMRRAEFNKAVLALAASVLFDPDRVTSAQTVDAALLDDLGSITADLTRRHHHAHPQTVLGPARAHLRYLLDLQATAATDVPGHLRPGLDRLTAKTAAIVGWVVFRSQADLVTAHAQLSLGRDYARRAGDRVLLAQLLAATSSQRPELLAGPSTPRPRSDVTAGAGPAARRRPRGRHRRTGSPRLAGRTHRRRAGAVRGPAHGASSARSRRGHPAELPSGRPGTAVLLLGRHPLPGVRG